MVFVKRTGWVSGDAALPNFDGAEAKVIREQCDFSQDTMAEAMGVSPRTVWAWENAGRAYHFTKRPQRQMLALLMEQGRKRVMGG